MVKNLDYTHNQKRKDKKEEGAVAPPSPAASTSMKSSSPEVAACVESWARGREQRNPGAPFPKSERGRVAGVLKGLLADGYDAQKVTAGIRHWWTSDRVDHGLALFATIFRDNGGRIAADPSRPRTLGTASGPPPARPGGLLPISDHEEACL